MKLRKKIFIAIICMLAMLSSVLVYTNFKILKFQSGVVQSINEAPTGTVAMIFGGGVNSDGSLGEATADRVKVGVELYNSHKVEGLLITGDDGALRLNEVSPMEKFARELGFIGSITVDRHGYRTYESCYRARAIFKVDNIIAVSQNFHLPRILYLCRGMGIKIVGVSADLRPYDLHDVVFMDIRELLARVKAWWQLEITRPMPMNLDI